MMGSLISQAGARQSTLSKLWALAVGRPVNPFGLHFEDNPRAPGPGQIVEWIVMFLNPSDCCALMQACMVRSGKHHVAKACTSALKSAAFLSAGFRSGRGQDVERLLSIPYLPEPEVRGALLGALHQLDASYGAEYLDEGGQRIEQDTNALRDALFAILSCDLGERHPVVQTLARERVQARGVVARHAGVSEHCFDAVWALCRVKVGRQDLIVSGSGDNTTILFWDQATGRQVKTLNAHDDEMTSLAADLVDGSKFWSGSEDGLVKLWSAASGSCEATFGPFSDDYGYVRALCCVIASNATSVALAGLYNGEIHAINADFGEATKGGPRLLCRLPSFVTSITLLEFGRANVAVGCGDKKVRVIHSLTGEVFHTLRGHLDGCFVMRSVHPPREVLELLGLGLGAPHNKMVSCSWDKTLRVWNLDDGSCARTLRGHTARVIACVVLNVDNVGDPVKQVIASCSIDGTVRFWDANSGACITMYTVGAKLFEVILLPDGGLAVGTENGRVVVLDYRSTVMCSTLSAEQSLVL